RRPRRPAKQDAAAHALADEIARVVDQLDLMQAQRLPIRDEPQGALGIGSGGYCDAVSLKYRAVNHVNHGTPVDRWEGQRDRRLRQTVTRNVRLGLKAARSEPLRKSLQRMRQYRLSCV